MPVLLLENIIRSYRSRQCVIWTQCTRNVIRIIVTGGLFIQHSLFCCFQRMFLFFFPSKLLHFLGGRQKKTVNSKECEFFFSGWVVLGNQSELLLSHNKHWLIDVWQNYLKIISIIKKEITSICRWYWISDFLCII